MKPDPWLEERKAALGRFAPAWIEKWHLDLVLLILCVLAIVFAIVRPYFVHH